MIRAIEEHYMNLTNNNVPRSIPDFYSEMQKLVYNQPTAFDTEKVVEQLEKLKQHNKKLSEGAYLEDDKLFYFCAYTNFARAIDIVKKVGVE